MELKLVSSDNRRDLYELGTGGTWKVCKILVAKEYCSVGNHYHKNKDELFLVLSGVLTYNDMDFFANETIFIERGTPHTFFLNEGCRLLCLASKEHDPNDDFKI